MKPFVKRRGDPLTRKEIEALELLCGGREQRQISAALNLDPCTVWYRLACAKMKLGAQTMEELAFKYGRLKPSK